jgi:hypothetical protein
MRDPFFAGADLVVDERRPRAIDTPEADSGLEREFELAHGRANGPVSVLTRSHHIQMQCTKMGAPGL